MVFPAENNSPLGVPVFNASGPAYHIWKGAELAVSIFWPNYYQVISSSVILHFYGNDNLNRVRTLMRQKERTEIEKEEKRTNRK